MTIRRLLIASLMLIAVGCGEQPQPPVLETPPTSDAPAPSAIQPAPPSDADGMVVQVEGGKWCVAAAGEVFFNGNEKLCSNIVTTSIRAAESGLRSVTMKSTYHQPGPLNGDDKMVGWNEAHILYDCGTDEFWVTSVVTYGVDDAVIQTETPDPPRKAPAANPDLGKIVCTPPL